MFESCKAGVAMKVVFEQQQRWDKRRVGATRKHCLTGEPVRPQTGHAPRHVLPGPHWSAPVTAYGRRRALHGALLQTRTRPFLFAYAIICEHKNKKQHNTTTRRWWRKRQVVGTLWCQQVVATLVPIFRACRSVVRELE